MSSYTQFKVNELKEKLRARNLSVNGTKSELIARLEAADSETGAATPVESEQAPKEQAPEDTEAPEAPKEETPKEETTNSTEPSKEPSNADAPTETSNDTTNEDPKQSESADAKEPEPKLSDEELLAKVMADLKTQIERAKRFGGNVAELEARVKRIEKFGIASVRDSMEKAKVSKPRFQKGRKFRNSKRKN